MVIWSLIILRYFPSRFNIYLLIVYRQHIYLYHCQDVWNVCVWDSGEFSWEKKPTHNHEDFKMPLDGHPLKSYYQSTASCRQGEKKNWVDNTWNQRLAGRCSFISKQGARTSNILRFLKTKICLHNFLKGEMNYSPIHLLKYFVPLFPHPQMLAAGCPAPVSAFHSALLLGSFSAPAWLYF